MMLPNPQRDATSTPTMSASVSGASSRQNWPMGPWKAASCGLDPVTIGFSFVPICAPSPSGSRGDRGGRARRHQLGDEAAVLGLGFGATVGAEVDGPLAATGGTE